MFCCKKCGKEFKYNWCLQRHLNKKKPCDKDTVNNLDNTVNNLDNTVNNLDNTVNNLDNTIKCKYCLAIFTRKENLNNHLKKCKEKGDYVRGLEIKLEIPMTETEFENECRFCHKVLIRKDHCNRHKKICKEKQNYREYLEEKN